MDEMFIISTKAELVADTYLTVPIPFHTLDLWLYILVCYKKVGQLLKHIGALGSFSTFIQLLYLSF